MSRSRVRKMCRSNTSRGLLGPAGLGVLQHLPVFFPSFYDLIPQETRRHRRNAFPQRLIMPWMRRHGQASHNKR